MPKSLTIHVTKGGANSPPPEQWYAVMHDKERYVWGLDYQNEENGYLWREKLPEVYWCPPQHTVTMNKEVQELCYGLFRYGAPSMSESDAKKRYRVIYRTDKAFTNKTGYPTPTFGGPRSDYINMLDLTSEHPKLDKPRFCGGALIRGQEMGGELLVKTIDSNNLPSLDYVIKERLYFTAVSVEVNFASDFNQGMGEPVFIPLISKVPVSYPLKFLRKLPLGYDVEKHDPHQYVV